MGNSFFSAKPKLGFYHSISKHTSSQTFDSLEKTFSEK